MLEQFSRDEIEVAAGAMRNNAQTEDSRWIGHSILGLSEYMKKNPTAVVELVLREMKSPFYLLAVPMARVDKQYIATLPHSGNREYPFCVNVIDSVRHSVAENYDVLKTTEKQNLIDLGNAGLAILRTMRRPPGKFQISRN